MGANPREVHPQSIETVIGNLNIAMHRDILETATVAQLGIEGFPPNQAQHMGRDIGMAVQTAYDAWEGPDQLIDPIGDYRGRVVVWGAPLFLTFRGSHVGTVTGQGQWDNHYRVELDVPAQYDPPGRTGVDLKNILVLGANLIKIDDLDAPQPEKPTVAKSYHEPIDLQTSAYTQEILFAHTVVQALVRRGTDPDKALEISIAIAEKAQEVRTDEDLP